MASKTAQEIMDEIHVLEHTLSRMTEALKTLCGVFHDISGCTGVWCDAFSECEYEHEGECSWPKSDFLEKKYWQIEGFYQKKKDKIQEKIERLHERRNNIGKKKHAERAKEERLRWKLNYDKLAEEKVKHASTSAG